MSESVAPVYVSAGNCHSLKLIGADLHEYMGGANIIPTTPHPITKEKAPLTIGHEFSGVIEEVGDDVTDIKIGQRVAIQPIIYDGTCRACRDGLINCCDNNGFLGLSGGFRPTNFQSVANKGILARLGRRTLGACCRSSSSGVRDSRVGINGSGR